MKLPNNTSPKGRRDNAIIRLFWENGLRRSEMRLLDIEDYDPTIGILNVNTDRGKLTLTLNEETQQALDKWINDLKKITPDSPLFFALDTAYGGHRMTEEGFKKVLKSIAV